MVRMDPALQHATVEAAVCRRAVCGGGSFFFRPHAVARNDRSLDGIQAPESLCLCLGPTPGPRWAAESGGALPAPARPAGAGGELRH